LGGELASGKSPTSVDNTLRECADELCMSLGRSPNGLRQPEVAVLLLEQVAKFGHSPLVGRIGRFVALGRA